MTSSDKKEFFKQYQEIHESLMRFCIVKSRGLMDPKDLANDVLLIGMENFHKLKNKQAFLSYLFTSATNICRNKAKRKKFSGNYEPYLAEDIQNPYENVDTSVDISLLYNALDQLPPLQKEAVILFEISDLPIKEIMAIQNSGSSAVKQRIKRGREKLTALLREKDHKKIAVFAATLSTSSAFSMSDINNYFNVIKELPLPLTEMEANQVIKAFKPKKPIGKSLLKKVLISASVVITINIIILLFIFGKTNEVVHLPDSNLGSITKFIKNKNLEKLNSSSLISVESENNSKTSLISIINQQTLFPKSIDKQNLTRDFLVKSTNDTILKNVISRDEDTQNHSLNGIKTICIEDLGNGKIEIKNWEKNEVKIIPNYTIVGKTPEDELKIKENANAIIEINDTSLIISDNIYRFGYGYEDEEGNDRFHRVKFVDKSFAGYETISINYTIMLPPNKNLIYLNNGGIKETIFPNIEGDVFIFNRRGNFSMGDVTGKADINITNGTGILGDFDQVEFGFSHANITFGNANKLEIYASDSKITGGEVNQAALKLRPNTKLLLKEINGDLEAKIKKSTLICEKSKITISNIEAIESTITLQEINDLNINLDSSELIANHIQNLNILNTESSILRVNVINNLMSVKSKQTTYEINELLHAAKIESYKDSFTISKVNRASISFKGKFALYNIPLTALTNYQFAFKGRENQLNYGKHHLNEIKHKERNNYQYIEGVFKKGKDNFERPLLLDFDCKKSEINLN